MRTSNIFFAALRNASIAAAASAALVATAPAQTIGAGWVQWGQGINYGMSVYGPERVEFGNVMAKAVYDTSNQKMSSNLSVTFYKSNQTYDGFDWYLAVGPFSHGVNIYKSFSELAKGWYGEGMSLRLTGRTATGAPVEIYDAQPASSTLTTSSGFNVGVSVGSGASGSLGYSNTVNAPDVTVNTIRDSSSVSYNLQLPSIGYSNKNLVFPIPANPYPASKSGTTFQFAVIYKVPSGQGLNVSIAEAVDWRFFYWGYSRKQTILSAIGNIVADFKGRQIQDASGRCLEVQGTQAYMAPCEQLNGQSSLQVWDYNQYSQIQNRVTGLCLDYAGEAQAGTQVVLGPCNMESVSQKWAIMSTKSSLGGNRLRSISGFVAYAPNAGASTVSLTSNSAGFETSIFLR